MTEDDVILQCKAMDLVPDLHLFTLTTNRMSAALKYVAVSWHSLDNGEKMDMIRSGNFFFSPEDAIAARERALVPSEEKALFLAKTLVRVS